MSQGAYALGDGWVLGGLAIFAAVALLGEGVLWPAERRLQAAVARRRTPTRPVPRGVLRPRRHASWRRGWRPRRSSSWWPGPC